MFQKRILSVGCVAAAAVALSSCLGAYSMGADTLTPNERIQAKLGAQYDVDPDTIEITDRNVVDGTTWFNTRIKGENLRCSFMMGGALSFGIMGDMNCNPR